MEFCIKERCPRPIFFLARTSTIIAMVIKPIPPVCIMANITNCPNSVQCVYVSNLISPVTQVAEVAVKKQSEIGVPPGPLDAIGSDNSNVPIRIIEQYPTNNSFIGEMLCNNLFMSLTIPHVFIIVRYIHYHNSTAHKQYHTITKVRTVTILLQHEPFVYVFHSIKS